jgi:hypothetical protein
MNPSGQSQPGPNNFPPNQGTSGNVPPAPNPYAQPNTPPATGWSSQPVGTPQMPQQPQAGWGQPANPYAQPQPAGQPYGPQPAGPQEYSADYLDQIAPGPGGPRLFSGSFTWIMIGLAIIFMFAVGVIALNNGGNNTATTQTAYFRITNLISITDNYRIYLKSSVLVSTNTNFKIYLTGAQHDLVDPLAKNGVATNKMDKTIKTSEKSVADGLTAKLEDARLNAILDRVYAREMAFQAQQLLNFYTKMTKSQSGAIANVAKSAIPNLQPIQKSFADFKDTEN